MGLPLQVIKMAETIFEILPTADALLWPVEFLNAVQPDRDYSDLHHVLAVARMDRLLEMHKNYDAHGLKEALILTKEYNLNPDESKRAAVYNAIKSTRAAIAAEHAGRSYHSYSLESLEHAARSADLTTYPLDKSTLLVVNSGAYSAAYSAQAASRSAQASSYAAEAVVWKAEKDALIKALMS
jgi:hypothetical protein